MSTTQIRGNTQIINGTIFDAQIASAAAIATSKLADGALFIKSDGSVVMGADLNLNTHKIINLVDPTNPQDAATRAWVLAQISSGVVSSQSVKAASTANIAALSGTQTIDGVSLAVNDTILVKNQTTQSANGLYVVQSGAWTRSTAMDVWAEVPGMIVSVQQGTVNADTVWLSTADPGGTLGTTNITFVQLPGPSDVQAGAGLLRTGQVIDIVAADNSLTVNADSLQVKLDPARAITVVAAGIGVNADANTMIISANVLAVRLDAAGAITSTASGIKVNLEGTNPTLQIATNQLGVKLDAAGAIVTGAAGIKANVDNATVEINTNALRVKPGGIGETQLGAGTYLRKVDKITRETPGGLVNGANTTYTLANTPVVGSEEVFLNGILQEPGAGNDYTISGATITYLAAPVTGDRLRVSYMK